MTLDKRERFLANGEISLFGRIFWVQIYLNFSISVKLMLNVATMKVTCQFMVDLVYRSSN